jgi:hypothetical protein
MKRLVWFLPLLFLLACDKVPPRVPPPVPDCVLNSPVVMTNTATSNSRKVLLEDYTGHTCGNCPRAAEEVERLLALYQGKVVALANHVSTTFAAPRKGYREDFRNPASTEWDGFFKMSATGLPQGGVNRMKVDGQYAMLYSAWKTVIPTALDAPQLAKIDLTTTYDPTQKLLNVKAKTTFLSDLPYEVSLIIVLTQDEIISNQTDYKPPVGAEVDPAEPDRVTDYKFDHIVIGSINGTWGDPVKLPPVNGIVPSPAKGDTVTILKNCNLVNRCFNQTELCVDDNHVNVVAFLYNTATREVVQVEKLKIR